MKVELNEEVVKTIKGVTIELTKEEADMLFCLVGGVTGYGELRNFTDKLYHSLKGSLQFCDGYWDNVKDKYKVCGYIQIKG